MNDVDPRLQSGANNPPPDLKVGEALREELRDNHRDLLARRDELLQMVEDFQADHASVDDDETSGVLAGVITQLSKVAKEAGAIHKGIKAPFLEGGRIVDNFFVGQIAAKLEQRAETLNRLQTAYLRAKDDRKRREAAEAAARARAEEDARRREAEKAEREKRAAERAAAKPPTLFAEGQGPDATAAAADAARRAEDARRAQEQARVERQAQEATAAASPAELSRTRGDYALASLRTTVDFEVEDITKVPPEFLTVNAPLVRAAIRGKDGRKTIPGLRIFEVRTAQNR